MTQYEMFPIATSSPQDTRANRSVSRGSAKAQKMTATSGRTSAKLLHKNDPLGAFSKMFMVTSQWASTKCLLTWKAKATPQGRLLFQLAVSMPHTEETASGSSPEIWPTPTTRDHKGGYIGGRIRNGKVSMDTLDVAVQYTDNQTKDGGTLNPNWVEWLMGYPIGHTVLKD
jgi:hypothetical protein